MIKQATKKFTSELVTEYSSTPNVVPMGTFENEMTLFINENGETGNIEWEYTSIEDEDEGGIVDIGLWFEGKTVTDFDGIFELPKEAIQMLKEHGYDCSEVES